MFTHTFCLTLNIHSVYVSYSNFEKFLYSVLDLYFISIRVNIKTIFTQSAKTRAEVSGGGRKPFRQKGTGRARAGSTRSPIWRKGGVVFAPQPRSYSYTLPKKVRRLALKSALSSKVQNGNIIILDQLTMPEPKTKEFAGMLNNLKVDNKALVVTANVDGTVVKSARNIPGVTPTHASSLNVYDVLVHDKLIMTRDAVTKVEEVLA